VRFHVLKRKLQNLWRRKAARLAALIIVVLITVGVQYVLVNRPQPVDLAVSKVVIPDIFSGQKLHVEALSDGLVITHGGKLSEEVDLHFSKARLAPNTLLDYDDLHPPTIAADIHCSPTNWQLQDAIKPKQTPKNAPLKPKPCSTSIALTSSTKGGAIAFDFFQTDSTQQNEYRHLVLQSVNSEANVQLKFLPALPFPTSTSTPLQTGPESTDSGVVDCGKILSVGSWQQRIGGATEIGINMEVGSSLRTRFTALENNLWPASPGYFEPFSFRFQQTGTASTPLNVGSVDIRSADGKESFSAKSSQGSLLRIDSLKVGADRLQLSLSGTAYVTNEGKPFDNESILKRLERYPLPAAALGALNLAIFAWALKVLKGLFS